MMTLKPEHCTYAEYEAYCYATGENPQVLGMMHELEPEECSHQVDIDHACYSIEEAQQALSAALKELEG